MSKFKVGDRVRKVAMSGGDDMCMRLNDTGTVLEVNVVVGTVVLDDVISVRWDDPIEPHPERHGGWWTMEDTCELENKE